MYALDPAVYEIQSLMKVRNTVNIKQISWYIYQVYSNDTNNTNFNRNIRQSGCYRVEVIRDSLTITPTPPLRRNGTNNSGHSAMIRTDHYERNPKDPIPKP